MKIQVITTEREYSLISIEEHLDLMRSKFDIVAGVGHYTEPQAVVESVNMNAMKKLHEGFPSDKELAELSMLFKQAHNYMELLLQQEIKKQNQATTVNL